MTTNIQRVLKDVLGPLAQMFPTGGELDATVNVALTLVRAGRLSAWEAAKHLAISPEAFLDLAQKYGVDVQDRDVRHPPPWLWPPE